MRSPSSLEKASLQGEEEGKSSRMDELAYSGDDLKATLGTDHQGENVSMSSLTVNANLIARNEKKHNREKRHYFIARPQLNSDLQYSFGRITETFKTRSLLSAGVQIKSSLTDDWAASVSTHPLQGNTSASYNWLLC